MKRNIFLIIILFSSILSQAQSGIGTQDPKVTLDVTASPSDMSKVDGVVAPRLTGNQLKSKDNLYTPAQEGTFVYVTELPTPASPKTQNITATGYYYFNGAEWIAFKASGSVTSDATRFLGGTVYNRFNSITPGNPQLPNSKVIGGGVGVSYNIGTLSHTSSKGGIVSVRGNGYTISNPSNGIFDIQFDVAMSEIYGISVSIMDAYDIGGTILGGAYPNLNDVGRSLLTNDNAQVAFISNTMIRIKTGGAAGVLANRPFTFLVVGK